MLSVGRHLVDNFGMDITVTNSEGQAIDLRSARTRVLESLIPVVQRAAGPTALFRDTRLMVGVSAGGTLVARLVPATR